MSKIFLLFYLSGVLLIHISACGQESVNLGLVSQLVRLKYGSEACTARIIADTAVPKLQKDSALSIYNRLRIMADGVIYQLIADMREHNSVKTYRRLNNYYKKHQFGDTGDAKESILSYVLAIQELDKTFKENYTPIKTRLFMDVITPSIVISTIDTGWTILKGIREKQGKKVDGITEIMKNLRLNPPNDLSKVKK